MQQQWNKDYVYVVVSLNKIKKTDEVVSDGVKHPNWHHNRSKTIDTLLVKIINHCLYVQDCLLSLPVRYLILCLR